MKNTKLIILLVTVILILIMVIPGCTQKSPTLSTTTGEQQSTTKVKDAIYRVLNPRGIAPKVDTKSLAPRLDTLDGKTIWISQAEADPVIMPALIERLKKEYTKTTWETKVTSSTGPIELSADEMKKAQALIQGNAW